MFEELKAFIAVVEQASLTKAADTLALTQSAVSRRVQHLEESLGVSLLDRTSRPPTTTPIGRRVYQSAILLMQDLHRLQRLVNEDSEPSGAFRLGMPQIVADLALFNVAVKLKAAFPTLDLRCHTNWSSELHATLAGGALDAAILMLPVGSEQISGLYSNFICRLDVLVVQSKTNPIILGAARLSDLAEQQWILNPYGCGYRAALQRQFENSGKQIRLGMDMHGGDMQLKLVASGMGLGLIPRNLLTVSSHVHALSVIDVPDFSLQVDLWLIRAMELGNLRRAFDLLQEVFTETLGDCRT